MTPTTRRHDPADHAAAITAVRAALAGGTTPAREDLAEATRALAAELGERFGGRTIELRVPPYAAVQLASPSGEGPRHTRGTPPNVVETDPVTFVALATGDLTWDDALASHRLRHSGARAAEVAGLLPLSDASRGRGGGHTAMGALMEGQGS